MDIYPVIVIYNRFCGDSPSCTALLQQGRRPLIVDNSTHDCGNAAFCLAHGLERLDMHGNAGISRAYNAALEQLQGRDGLVLWLDDDTELPEDYFAALERAAGEDQEAQVFLPLVVSLGDQSTILSPCLYGKYKMRRVAAAEELTGRALSAINSGMAVRLSLYAHYRYDEALFLDYVDHDFMAMCRREGVGVHVLTDTRLYQNFSGDSHPTREQAMTRLNIFEKDFRVYGKKHGLSPLVTGLLLARKRSKLPRA